MTRSGRLRSDLPFRRIAVLLSGGGALGAYQVGVLRVLERIGLRPYFLSGVSIGAVNAVIWLASGCRTAALEQTWGGLRPASLGIRWITLGARAVGGLFVAVALVEVPLTLSGAPGLLTLVSGAEPPRAGGMSAALDVVAWVVVGVGGFLLARLSRRAEGWLARLSPAADPERLQRRLGRALIAGAVIHLGVWAFDVPWPLRFSAMVLIVGAGLWLAGRSSFTGERIRRLMMALAPEAQGRGLWGSEARASLIRGLLRGTGDGTLVGGETRLVISALALDSGRICHFVNWPDPDPEFCRRLERALDEVIVLQSQADVLQAAIASSAIPVVYEPVVVHGREFVDAGGFANQPLRVAVADGADAALVVLLYPSGNPSRQRPDSNLFELGGRLLELASWRDLQAEFRQLPDEWTRRLTAADGAPGPRRLCVVEPEDTIPGSVLAFDPAQARELIRRGERDAWRALAAAGWLAPEDRGAAPS